MADGFMPNLDCEERACDALSFLGAGGRMGHAKTMDQYENLGWIRDRDLHSVVADRVPDSTATTSASSVRMAPTPRQPSVFYDAFGTRDVYDVDCKDEFCADDIDGEHWDVGATAWKAVLLFDPKGTGVDINYNTPYKSLTVRNTSQLLKKLKLFPGMIPLEVQCDPQGKFIMTLREFRVDDYSEGTRRVPINELAWQIFALTAGANTRHLQVMFILDIQNNGFQTVLEDAHRETGRPIDKPAVWTREDWPHFMRLLGTESVSGKVLQLTNHHNAVGNKRIAKIITTTRFVKDSRDQENGKLTAALVLEPIPENDLLPFMTERLYRLDTDSD